MSLLSFGFLLLVASFVVQLIVWRIALPRRQTRALLAIFFLTPCVIFLISRLDGRLPVWSVAELALLVLFYTSYTLAYIVIYSAIENQSPTLAIVSYLAAGGDGGRSDAEMFAKFGEGDALANRFALIEDGGWVQRDGDMVTLTPEGRFYGRLFETAATIFAIAKGG